MTAFTPADLPSGINTVEQVFLWSAMSLRTMNPTIGVLETPDVTQRVCQVGHFDAADGTRRALVRHCIELDPIYDFDNSQKLWRRAKEVSQTALPAAYKVN